MDTGEYVGNNLNRTVSGCTSISKWGIEKKTRKAIYLQNIPEPKSSIMAL